MFSTSYNFHFYLPSHHLITFCLINFFRSLALSGGSCMENLHKFSDYVENAKKTRILEFIEAKTVFVSGGSFRRVHNLTIIAENVFAGKNLMRWKL